MTRLPFRLIIVTGLMLGLGALNAGCADSAKTGNAADNYRTITTQPRRDTDAARRQNQRGLEHLAEDELNKAAEAFGRALSADVEFGPAHNNLGKVHFKQRDWYKAAWEFEYAAQLMPRQPEPRNNLGLVLEQVGELDRAVEQYRQAVALAPDEQIYRAHLVRAMIRRGDRTDEVRHLLEQLEAEALTPEWRNWVNHQRARLAGRTSDR